MPMKQRVYFDFTIGNKSGGRVVFELYPDATPNASKNFRGLSTGEFGFAKSSGKPLHYQGSKIFYVQQGYCIKGGDFENNDGTGGESIFGGEFKDESFSRKHAQAGVLAVLNKGRNRNGSQFMITLRKLPSLDGKQMVIGQVVEGMDVIRAIEAIPIDPANRPRVPVVICDCGQLEVKRLNRSDPRVQMSLELNQLMKSAEISAIESKKKEEEGNLSDEGDEGERLSHKKTRRKFFVKKPDAENAAVQGRLRLQAAAKKAKIDMLASKVSATKENEDTVSTSDRPAIDEAVADPSANKSEQPEQQLPSDAFKRRLMELQLKKNQARKLNNLEAKEENKKILDPAYERKQTERLLNAKERKESGVNETEKAGVAIAGREYLQDTALLVSERKSKDKKNASSFGWNVFNQETLYRAHNKRLQETKFQKLEYEKQKNELGEMFYNPHAALVSAAFKPTEEAKDRLVESIDKQISKRKEFSRRRMHVEEEDVSYINERNKIFNKKLERSFGQYSLEIKQNLERGTAL